MTDLEYRIQHLENKLEEVMSLQIGVNEQFKVRIDEISWQLHKARKQLQAEMDLMNKYYTEKERQIRQVPPPYPYNGENARNYIKRLLDEAHANGIRKAAEE